MTASDRPRGKPDRPGSRSFPIVMSVFAALLLVGVVSGFVIHRRFIAFERAVAHHVPSDVTLAVRWDVEKVTLFEPTRRFLLPLFDETPSSDLDPGDRSRRRRLARESGLELGRDLREALVLFGPEPNDWAVALGGSFPKTGVADAVERVLRDEGRGMKRLGPERLVSPAGIAFGRAADGVLVIASSPERLEATAAVRSPIDAIPRTGAGSALVRPGAPGLGPEANGLLSELGSVTGVEARADWGTPIVVDVTIHYAAEPPPDALPRARRALGRLMGPGPVPPVEVMRESPRSDPKITFRIRMDDDALDRALRRASDSVYGTLWQNGRKSAAP